MTLSFRVLAAGLALVAAAPTPTPALAPTSAPTPAAASSGPHDSNAPVNYEADRIELQDKADRVLLSGNVVITQADLTMHSPRAVVAYTNNGAMQIQRLDATGGVTVVRGDETATSDVATYDFNARLITMVGHVVVRRGTRDEQHSGRLVIDLNTHITTTDAGPGGRVSGTFAVPKHDKTSP
ncbi:MAG: OstA family protein [Sphingomonadales bacterium]|nr:OstA family protein [Sphingomonadales bacterium]